MVGNYPADSLVRKLLLRESYVSEADLHEAETYAKAHDISVVEYLLQHQLLSKSLLGQAVAESIGTYYANLSDNPPDAAVVTSLPEDVCRKYRLLLIEDGARAATFATDDTDLPKIERVAQVIKKDAAVSLVYTLPEDFETVLGRYKKPLNTRFTDIIKKQAGIAPEILQEIISDALDYDASDVHFEPGRRDVVIRFRIDGLLREAGRVSKEYYENILNRIKVESGMAIDEHFSAQDGTMHYAAAEGREVDIRISIIPTVEGEKIVLRVLASYIRGLTLDDIGLSAAHKEQLITAARQPFGMILVTGPTGSGKTTSLYSLLKLLNQPEVNITTIEDPVEYKMEGVNQIQVRAVTGLTFAKGLRSIVRQDPDIILVGEIRDQETTEIAINAALTGHLVLSTFHANDAATTFLRLGDMQADPFLLASTLEVVIAQRLVRKLCGACRYSQNAREATAAYPWVISGKYLAAHDTVYASKGCEVCNGTGYKGRIGLFEFIVVGQAMQDLLLAHPTAEAIKQLARREGARTLFEDGIDKVKSGLTTTAEVLRVAQAPVAAKQPVRRA